MITDSFNFQNDNSMSVCPLFLVILMGKENLTTDSFVFYSPFLFSSFNSLFLSYHWWTRDRNILQSWALIRKQIRMMAWVKKCVFANMPHVLVFGLFARRVTINETS